MMLGPRRIPLPIGSGGRAEPRVASTQRGTIDSSRASPGQQAAIDLDDCIGAWVNEGGAGGEVDRTIGVAQWSP